MEVLPAVRRFTLCRPHHAPHPHARALRHDSRTIEAFAYEEAVDGTDHSKYLWGNAALAGRTTHQFVRQLWMVRSHSRRGERRTRGRPSVHNFRTDEGDIVLKCPTEVSITDRREKELADQGFVSLVHCKGTDNAAFFAVQTANKPKLYDKPEANANAKLSAQLPYIMAMSRFAHYMKAMMRDKIGGTMSRSQAEHFLNQWVANYVIEDDNAADRQRRQRSLCAKQGSRSWKCQASAGKLRAVAFLRPHFHAGSINGLLEARCGTSESQVVRTWGQTCAASSFRGTTSIHLPVETGELKGQLTWQLISF